MTSATSLLTRLKALDTNTISDAMDFLSLPGAVWGIQPLWQCPAIVGRVSTVKLGPKKGDTPAPHLISPVIDATTEKDRVLVISGGTMGISCWGDILANAAKQKGIAGTIIEGYSRDIEGSESIDYPVFGRGITMISARNRLIQEDAGCAIDVGGVAVFQDDYVIADRCGTVFISPQHIENVLSLAERIDARQQKMVQAVRAGKSVEQVMHDKEFDAINAS